MTKMTQLEYVQYAKDLQELLLDPTTVDEASTEVYLQNYNNQLILTGFIMGKGIHTLDDLDAFGSSLHSELTYAEMIGSCWDDLED